MRVLTRVGAWSCVVAIAVLSLLPADDLVRTDLGGHAEHIFAYAVTTLIVALAYTRLHVALVFAALTGYAACLEYLQRFSPGRNSSLVDLAFSALGVVVGLGAFVLVSKLWLNRTRRHN